MQRPARRGCPTEHVPGGTRTWALFSWEQRRVTASLHKRSRAPCNSGGNGLYPASSLQPCFEDVGNCLSNVTIKSHFSGVFNCSKENSIATLGPTGRTMSMLNALHQILRSYPEALAEQTSPSWTLSNQFLSQSLSVSFSICLSAQPVVFVGFLAGLVPSAFCIISRGS